MRQRMNERTMMCAVGILLFLFAVPASASDAMLDRSRTQSEDLDANQINYIHARFNEVTQDLFLIPEINSIVDYVSGSSNDHAFVNNINGLNDTIAINVVLLHSHGGSTSLSFKDGSHLYAGEVDNWMDDRNRGFMFAGACSSARHTDLGNAFIDKGFDTFFGYENTVLTLHNARFYAAFFDLATFVNVEVSEAARYAGDEVEEEFGSADDVRDSRFIGNSSLCLRT
ncbi:MAG: hypothetical protein PHE51_12635 [Eubacteriales bacterium]|nr:hypothetical protein [Eubacteriales bacterium]